MSTEMESDMTARESNKLAKVAHKRLLSEAREKARDGHDVRPGTQHFWDLMTAHMALVSDLCTAVADEHVVEVKAMGEEYRLCEQRGTPGCKNKVFKRYVRGRWPQFCETCRPR